LNADVTKKKERSVALSSTKKSSKALKAKAAESDGESSLDDQEDEQEDDEFAMFTGNFQKWAKMNNKNFRGNNSRNSSSK